MKKKLLTLLAAEALALDAGCTIYIRRIQPRVTITLEPEPPTYADDSDTPPEFADYDFNDYLKEISRNYSTFQNPALPTAQRTEALDTMLTATNALLELTEEWAEEEPSQDLCATYMALQSTFTHASEVAEHLYKTLDHPFTEDMQDLSTCIDDALLWCEQPQRYPQNDLAPHSKHHAPLFCTDTPIKKYLYDYQYSTYSRLFYYCPKFNVLLTENTPPKTDTRIASTTSKRTKVF